MSYNSLGVTDIHVLPFSNKPPRFLEHDNYLGEFKTKIDKARVRENLGIVDDLSLQWGKISGSIHNQTDLIELVQTALTQNTYTDDIKTLYQYVSNMLDTIDSLKKNIENLLYTVEELHAPKATLSEIIIPTDSINVEEKSNAYSLVVYAKFSDNTTLNITNSALILSSNEVVASWNKETDQIVFNGAGTCSILIFYEDQLKLISVTVNAKPVYLYVGYASDYTEVIGNANCKFDTVANTWTPDNTPLISTEERMGFWVCTTEDISSFKEIGLFDLDEIHFATITYDDNLYNVYVIGVESNESIFTITVK